MANRLQPIDLEALFEANQGGFSIPQRPLTAPIGDIDGDGRDDLLVTSSFFGEAGTPSFDAVIFGRDDDATIDLANIAPEDGFVVRGGATRGAEALGDVNGDAFDDVNGDGVIDFLARAFDPVRTGGEDVAAIAFGQLEDDAPMAGLVDANGLDAAFVAGDGASELIVTFESEDSVSADSLGYYVIDEEGFFQEAAFLFPNADADGSGTLGEVGVAAGDQASLGVLEEGERAGLFLLNHGFSPVVSRYIEESGPFEFRNPLTGGPANIDDDQAPELIYTTLQGVELPIWRDPVYHAFDAEPGSPRANALNRDGFSHVRSAERADGVVEIGFDDRLIDEDALIDRPIDGLVVTLERVAPLDDLLASGDEIAAI